jgi:hypothetical protein
VKKRRRANRRIIDAAVEAQEGASALGSVGARIAAVRRRANSESIRGRQKPKAGKGESDERKTEAEATGLLIFLSIDFSYFCSRMT